MKLKGFAIDNLISQLPIMQGGMGVGISLSGLASSVASYGGVGVISSAQIGFNFEGFEQNAMKANFLALANHLKLAKQKAKGGIIGVNIMCAMRGYEDCVRCCVENMADIIISGAGLPINLPELVKGSLTKIAPIVSSFKATNVLLKLWDKRYGKTADLIVIEGAKAGGHLGFTPEQAEQILPFDDEIKLILECVQGYEEKYDKKIPVIFGGGVFDKEDMNHYLDIGCSGVQIASRFVTTEECDAPENFKQAYINAEKEDIGIIKSPVGMPGRAIMNNFIKRITTVREEITKCYSCLLHCDPKTTPYCISKALINSAKGDTENGLVFCGAETYRVKEMGTVGSLIRELTQ